MRLGPLALVRRLCFGRLQLANDDQKTPFSLALAWLVPMHACAGPTAAPE
jgi:hypothetical protein